LKWALWYVLPAEQGRAADNRIWSWITSTTASSNAQSEEPHASEVISDAKAVAGAKKAKISLSMRGNREIFTNSPEMELVGAQIGAGVCQTPPSITARTADRRKGKGGDG
jgi:hypothetical protein